MKSIRQFAQDIDCEVTASNSNLCWVQGFPKCPRACTKPFWLLSLESSTSPACKPGLPKESVWPTDREISRIWSWRAKEQRFQEVLFSTARGQRRLPSILFQFGHRPSGGLLK